MGPPKGTPFASWPLPPGFLRRPPTPIPPPPPSTPPLWPSPCKTHPVCSPPIARIPACSTPVDWVAGPSSISSPKMPRSFELQPAYIKTKNTAKRTRGTIPLPDEDDLMLPVLRQDSVRPKSAPTNQSALTALIPMSMSCATASFFFELDANDVYEIQQFLPDIPLLPLVKSVFEVLFAGRHINRRNHATDDLLPILHLDGV